MGTFSRKKKYKHKTISGQYFPIPVKFLHSNAFASLSSKGKHLFVDLLSRYNGYNNGDLSFTWKIAKERGWKSPDTLSKALNELLDKKIIIKTRQGSKNKCNLFALTLYVLDECNGKLDHGFKATNTPIGGWDISLCPLFFKE